MRVSGEPRGRPAMPWFAAMAWVLAACAGGPQESTSGPVAPISSDRRATRPEPSEPAASTTALALTLDDLPWAGDVARGDSPEAGVARILSATAEVPMTGFVTCQRPRSREAAWAQWRASRVELANHTRSHRSIDDYGTLDAWRRDVEACQRELASAQPPSARYFRYPFLRTGRERARRDAGFEVLREMGLERAPVTIDTSDWALARVYAERRDPAVADAYVEHVRRAARRYRALAENLGHGASPQILLLHANALAADHLGRLLDALREDGFHFIPLEQALADPLYARPDHYVGATGMSWLYRVADTPEAWAWDAAQLHAMRVRFRGATERSHFDLDARVSVRCGAERWVFERRITDADGDAHPRATLGELRRMSDGTLRWARPIADPNDRQAALDWAATRFGPAAFSL